MSTQLSARVTQIQPSATIAVNTRANELRVQGYEIINLSVGEPDFDTPDFIKQAAINAIKEGFTKYTAVDGITPLKQAIINKLKRDNDLDYIANEIIVGNGVKHCIYNLAVALLNEGDEVIIPSPYWVSYPAIVTLVGANPVIIETTHKNNFKITPEQLEKAITSKTRILMLNSPSNPTGIAYSLEELKALGEILQKHPQIIIASDDIYEYILWGLDKYVNILNACPALKEQAIILNGVSKAHAMTGWRIGYAAGPQAIITAMKKVQSQNTSNPNSIAQHAAAVAIDCDRSQLNYMFEAFKKRHDMMHKQLCAINGVECLPADGAFYLFPNVEKAVLRHKLKDDIALAEKLLNEAKVAVVPGTAFGAPNHIRISIANSEENLKKALELITPILQA